METEEDIIKTIRTEIFSNAKESNSLEIMHWYMWLDDCFENDEFYKSNAEKVRYRIWVLKNEGELVRYLIELLGGLLELHGCISDGKWIEPYLK